MNSPIKQLKVSKVGSAHFLYKRVERARPYEINYLHVKFRKADFILV